MDTLLERVEDVADVSSASGWASLGRGRCAVALSLLLLLLSRVTTWLAILGRRGSSVRTLALRLTVACRRLAVLTLLRLAVLSLSLSLSLRRLPVRSLLLTRRCSTRGSVLRLRLLLLLLLTLSGPVPRHGRLAILTLTLTLTLRRLTVSWLLAVLLLLALRRLAVLPLSKRGLAVLLLLLLGRGSAVRGLRLGRG